MLELPASGYRTRDCPTADPARPIVRFQSGIVEVGAGSGGRLRPLLVLLVQCAIFAASAWIAPAAATEKSRHRCRWLVQVAGVVVVEVVLDQGGHVVCPKRVHSRLLVRLKSA
jgi:hypothetical protein